MKFFLYTKEGKTREETQAPFGGVKKAVVVSLTNTIETKSRYFWRVIPYMKIVSKVCFIGL